MAKPRPWHRHPATTWNQKKIWEAEQADLKQKKDEASANKELKRDSDRRFYENMAGGKPQDASAAALNFMYNPPPGYQQVRSWLVRDIHIHDDPKGGLERGLGMGIMRLPGSELRSAFVTYGGKYLLCSHILRQLSKVLVLGDRELSYWGQFFCFFCLQRLLENFVCLCTLWRPGKTKLSSFCCCEISEISYHDQPRFCCWPCMLLTHVVLIKLGSINAAPPLAVGTQLQPQEEELNDDDEAVKKFKA